VDLFFIHIKKNLILFFAMGALYMVLEGLWRGWTNISMLAVGGLCGFFIGKMNDGFGSNKTILEKCLIGMIIILTIEFISGMVLNIYFHLGIWDYSNIWGNLFGQICVPYAILWFLMVPFVIYVYNYLKYFLFQEEAPGIIWDNYKKLFLGR
jgi:uncharacterized membrane protein